MKAFTPTLRANINSADVELLTTEVTCGQYYAVFRTVQPVAGINDFICARIRINNELYNYLPVDGQTFNAHAPMELLDLWNIALAYTEWAITRVYHGNLSIPFDMEEPTSVHSTDETEYQATIQSTCPFTGTGAELTGTITESRIMELGYFTELGDALESGAPFLEFVMTGNRYKIDVRTGAMV